MYSATETEKAVADQASSGKTKCSNCRVPRTAEHFVGKRGGVVKRCLKCREKDDKQKRKPENVKKNNKRQRENQYWKKYVEKKRREDEEGYLVHRALTHKAWVARNKDHVKRWSKMNVGVRLTGAKQQARVKGIAWTVTDEVCKAMVKAPCAYCHCPVTDTLHGITRMDTDAEYSVENCVTSCKQCTFVKKCLDPGTFIERCRHVSFLHGDVGALYPESFKANNSATYGSYAVRANEKELSFELTPEEYAALVNGGCHYCHRKTEGGHINGIDRKDNALGYSLDNCVTCCADCNHSKANMGDADFIEHCKAVARAWVDKDLPFASIPRRNGVIRKRVNDDEEDVDVGDADEYDGAGDPDEDMGEDTDPDDTDEDQQPPLHDCR